MSEDINLPDKSLQIVQQAEEMVAKIDKQAFKAMFYLFAGKPDSKQRSYEGKTLTAPEDICDLAGRVNKKFELHNIDTEVFSISVALEKKKTIDFSALAEFKNQDWRIPEAVQEITMRWDFLIRIASHVVPQRHTLTVRMARNSPGPQGMQIMINELSQQISLMGMGDSCFAKIDFINHSLADELLALVGDWHAALRRPANHKGFLCRLEPIDRWVAHLVRVSLPMALGLCLYGYLWKVLPVASTPIVFTTEHARSTASFTIVAVVLFIVASAIGKNLGGRIYNAINSYGGHHPFEFTRGDDKTHSEIKEQDSTSLKQFSILVIVPLVINIIAGILLWRMLPPATP